VYDPGINPNPNPNPDPNPNPYPNPNPKSNPNPKPNPNPGTDFIFLVEVFQDPLERAIVNTLWQV